MMADSASPSPSPSPLSPPVLTPWSPSFTSTVTSRGHSFLLRPLIPSDVAYIAELSRYSYEGKDFIMNDFPRWMQPHDPIPPLPIGVVYLGPSTPSLPSPSSHSSDPRLGFLQHVVAIEVCQFLDEGSTAWLYALRVHPVFRALSLSSLLHAAIIAAAESRPGVRRVRESTERTNEVSMHLATKHLFSPVYESRYYWAYRDQWQPKMDAVLRLMQRHSVHTHQATLTTEGRGGLMALGGVEDVLAVHKRHAAHPAFAYLLQSWICFEVSQANVERLTTEAGLTHEVVVSYEGEGEGEGRVPVAFSLTRFAIDFTSPTQNVTVYAVSVRHLLLHVYYAMQRQAQRLDDDQQYQRPQIFLPACFEGDMRSEEGGTAVEGAGDGEDAWVPDKYFVLLERPVK